MVVLIGIPAGLGLALLAGPLLVSLFQYGQFSGEDARMATRSLVAFAIGLPAFMFIKILVPGFYSRQDTRTPVRIGIIALLANMLFNVVLVFPLAHAGLALATTLSAYLNGGLLYRKLRQANVYQPRPGWADFLWRCILADLGLAFILSWGSGELDLWIARNALARGGYLLLWLSVGIASYFALLTLLRINLRGVLLGHAHRR